MWTAAVVVESVAKINIESSTSVQWDVSPQLIFSTCAYYTYIDMNIYICLFYY